MIDEECTGEKICGVPVVVSESDVPMPVCGTEWIDEVLIVISEDLPYPDWAYRQAHRNRCNQVHLNLAKNHQSDRQKTVCGKKLEAIQF